MPAERFEITISTKSDPELYRFVTEFVQNATEQGASRAGAMKLLLRDAMTLHQGNTAPKVKATAKPKVQPKPATKATTPRQKPTTPTHSSVYDEIKKGLDEIYAIVDDPQKTLGMVEDANLKLSVLNQNRLSARQQGALPEDESKELSVTMTNLDRDIKFVKSRLEPKPPIGGIKW